LLTPSLTVAGRLDQVLGFLQAQAGDGADGLDDLDLLLAGSGFRMTVNSVCSSTGAAAAAGPAAIMTGAAAVTPNFSSIGLDQLHDLHQGLAGDGFEDLLVGKGHCDYLWNVFLENLFVFVVQAAAFCGRRATVTPGDLLEADRP
jgi:acetyl-CoA acetyltransferase